MRLLGQDLSHCGRGKEALISERGKPSSGKLLQVLFQQGQDMGALPTSAYR